MWNLTRQTQRSRDRVVFARVWEVREKGSMGVKLPVERLTNSEDLMYSPVIRVNDIVS